MNDIILSTIPTILIAATVGLTFVLFILAVYDLVVTRRTKQLATTKLPNVTIIIFSIGEADDTKNCLTSIWNIAPNKKLDVVVVGSVGHRSELAQLKKHTKADVRVRYYQPRKAHAYRKLVFEAYSRSKRGSVVVVVDSNMYVTKSLFDTVARLETIMKSGKIVSLLPTGENNGLVGVVMTLKGSVYRLSMKVKCALNVPMPATQQGNGYALDSSLITNKRAERMAWVCDGSSVKIPRSRLNIDSLIGTDKKVAARLVGVVSVSALILVMVQAAIAGNGLEAMTNTWVLITVIAMILVFFDASVDTRRKIDTLACFGFMPIMVLIAYLTSIEYKNIS